MRVPGLNLGEWLRRLKLDRSGDPPELSPLIIPTMLVGDASMVVPPIRGPAAWFGGRIPNTVEAASVFVVESRGAGGCFVRSMVLESGNPSEYNFWIGDLTPFEPPVGNPAIFNAQECIPNIISNAGRPLSRLLIGDSVGITFTSTQSPSIFFAAANVVRILPYVWYIPPGSILFCEGTSNGLLRVDCIIEDVPALDIST